MKNSSCSSHQVRKWYIWIKRRIIQTGELRAATDNRLRLLHALLKTDNKRLMTNL